MTERDLRKLSRTDLLEMLLEQSRKMEELQSELERVQSENKAAKEKLNQREISLMQAGSIADAALQLNGVFTAAEKACEQYIDNIKNLSCRQEAICAQMEEETRQKCAKMLADAKYQSELYWDAVNKKVEQLLDSHKGLRDLIQGYSK
jgi:hypothetical protein